MINEGYLVVDRKHWNLMIDGLRILDLSSLWIVTSLSGVRLKRDYLMMNLLLPGSGERRGRTRISKSWF